MHRSSRLLPQVSFSALLGLLSAGAGRAASRTLDALGAALLEPFKEFVQRLQAHLDGVLAWTRLRVSNGALEGMNNKIKLVSHRSSDFGPCGTSPRRSTTAAHTLHIIGGILITLLGDEPQIRECENMLGEAERVRRVLAQAENGVTFKQPVERVERLARPARDYPRAPKTLNWSDMCV